MPVGVPTARYRRLAVAVLVVIAVGCTIGVLVPAGLGWDFANFYDAGHRVAAGQAADLYHQNRPIAGRPPQGNMRFWGAPLSAVLFAPLALLRPEIALVAFKLQNVVALALALVLLYRHCRLFVPTDPDQRSMFTAMFLTLCVAYQPFWTIFRVGGQTTPTVFLLLVVALFCYTTSRLIVAALLLVVAVMIKPSLAVMLAFLVLVSGVAFAGALAIAAACAGLLSVATLGWAIHEQFLKVLLEGSALSRSWLYNSSLYVPFENFRLLAPTGSWNARVLMSLEWTVRLIVVGAFVVIMRSSRRETWPAAARRHFEFLMAICFWLLTSQLIWEHYLQALFIPLTYFFAARTVFSHRAQLTIAALFGMAVGQNLILVLYASSVLPLESTAGLILAGLVKAGPLMLLVMLLSLHHGEIFASYRLPAWNNGPEGTAGPRRSRAAVPS